NIDFALALQNLAEFNHAINFADDRGFMRLASFEQLDHTRQTSGDVLSLGSLAWDLGQHVAGINRIAVLDHEVSTRRHQVTFADLVALDHDSRLPLLVG